MFYAVFNSQYIGEWYEEEVKEVSFHGFIDYIKSESLLSSISNNGDSLSFVFSTNFLIEFSLILKVFFCYISLYYSSISF